VNLVLICSDTFRWDYLGCYGNDWIKTPNLDKLASESAVYLDAFAEGLPTIPVRRVLLTGRRIFPFSYYPQKSDLVQCAGWHPLFDEDVTLAETLKEQGYVTCFVNDTYHLMKPGKNFHRGFDCWYWIRGQEDDRFQIRDRKAVQKLLDEATGGREWAGKKDHWLVQHMMNRSTWKSDADTNVAKAMIRAADWVKEYIERRMEDPFFLYVDVFDPHEPWDPPQEYGKMYYPGYRGVLGTVPPASTKNMTDEQFEMVKAAYAGEVTLTDRWTGHLLDALRETGVMDDTLVIFTSDHGTMMGEQGQVHKGGDRLRNQCTQVPLIIRHPQGQAAGAKVKGFVQHQDIMPTALKLMGLSVPDRVQGEDVWPMASEGKPSRTDRIITAFHHHASVRTAKWNYVAPWVELKGDFKGRFELYDLEADPQELTNVIEEHPDVARELDEYLKNYVKDHADETKGTLGPGQPLPVHDPARI